MKYILDTNVMVRFLVGDVPDQKKKAEQWFKEAESGKRDILVPAVTIAEVSFVLESYYKLSREQIIEALTVFISQRWLEIPDRQELLLLWEWYRKGLHFVDSLLLAYSQVSDYGVLTFDKEMVKQIKS